MMLVWFVIKSWLVATWFLAVKRKICHRVWHILLFRTAAASTQQNPCQCYYSKAECDAICCQVWLSGSAATRTNILVKDVQNFFYCFCYFKPCEHIRCTTHFSERFDQQFFVSDVILPCFVFGRCFHWYDLSFLIIIQW